MSLARQYRTAILLCSFVAFTVLQAYPAATVIITNAPSSISPGQSITISTQFSKTSDEPEKRIVLRLDLHNSDTHLKVAGAIADNGGAGYTGSTGTIPCTITIPSNATGSYYFKATVAPWSLNRAIVAHYKTYPTDGTFTYLWSGGGYGVTQTVMYLGAVAAPKPAGDTCYCSGLAFETCVLPFNAYNATYNHPYIGNIYTPANMETFRKVWYGVTDAEKLAARALPEWGAGREITDFEEAQEGDFVQLWRHSGSGHNPVFVRWLRNSSNQITGVRYWGTQGSTNGIGYNNENFGTSSGMNRSRFYIGRAAKPRAPADYDWALGQASSQETPSTVSSSITDWFLY